MAFWSRRQRNQATAPENEPDPGQVALQRVTESIHRVAPRIALAGYRLPATAARIERNLQSLAVAASPMPWTGQPSLIAVRPDFALKAPELALDAVIAEQLIDIAVGGPIARWMQQPGALQQVPDNEWKLIEKRRRTSRPFFRSKESFEDRPEWLDDNSPFTTFALTKSPRATLRYAEREAKALRRSVHRQLKIDVAATNSVNSYKAQHLNLVRRGLRSLVNSLFGHMEGVPRPLRWVIRPVSRRILGELRRAEPPLQMTRTDVPIDLSQYRPPREIPNDGRLPANAQDLDTGNIIGDATPARARGARNRRDGLSPDGDTPDTTDGDPVVIPSMRPPFDMNEVRDSPPPLGLVPTGRSLTD